MNNNRYLNIHSKYNIAKKGVIHIGAHEGQEYEYYKKLQLPEIIFIEANPVVYNRLIDKMKIYPEVTCYCGAISDKIENRQFHITSMDQSSSLLPLKLHLVDFPSIKETQQIDVLCITIDELMYQLKKEPHNFNFLNIDIQGADLLALKGGTNLLTSHIELINIEVNYIEMYEGCALKQDIDNFLNNFGFYCVEYIDYSNKKHWGDAVYIKKK